MYKSILLPITALTALAIVGLKLTNTESFLNRSVFQPDKPSISNDNARIHHDRFKRYDSNTMTIEIIEECMKIAHHRERTSVLLDSLQLKLTNSRHYLMETSGASSDAIDLHREMTHTYNDTNNHMNRLNQTWNQLCAGKRYYLDDYHSAKWIPNTSNAPSVQLERP